MDVLIESDDLGRVQLPGRPHQQFLMRENSDGSLQLVPTRVVTVAQAEYDCTPGLRQLLARATDAPTVRRTPRLLGA